MLSTNWLIDIWGSGNANICNIGRVPCLTPPPDNMLCNMIRSFCLDINWCRLSTTELIMIQFQFGCACAYVSPIGGDMPSRRGFYRFIISRIINLCNGLNWNAYSYGYCLIIVFGHRSLLCASFIVPLVLCCVLLSTLMLLPLIFLFQWSQS